MRMKEERKLETRNKKPIQQKTLRQLREELGISRQKMGEDLFIHPQSLFNYEIGRTEPGVTLAVSIADYFGVTIYDIKW